MSASLFKSSCKSCLGPTALDELDCLGVEVKNTDCTIENAAPYEQDFSELLSYLPVFSLELPLDENGMLFGFLARVLFVKDAGYRVEVRRAKTEIFSFVQALNDGNWDVLAEIKLEKKFEPYTLFQLHYKYKFFNDSKTSRSWKDTNTSWSELSQKWNSILNNKDYLYRGGDSFITLSPCQETMCLYLVTEDISPLDYTNFSSGPWTKISCIDTGFNKCLGHSRKKQPRDLFEVIELGSNCDKVEVPIPYTPPEFVYEFKVP